MENSIGLKGLKQVSIRQTNNGQITKKKIALTQIMIINKEIKTFLNGPLPLKNPYPISHKTLIQNLRYKSTF